MCLPLYVVPKLLAASSTNTTLCFLHNPVIVFMSLVRKPMHMQPFYAEYDFIGEGRSKKILENGVCLPSDTNITDEIKKVCDVIIFCYKVGDYRYVCR